MNENEPTSQTPLTLQLYYLYVEWSHFN